MVPLIKEHIAERPNMSNKECSQLLNLYVRDVFFTKMILQIARSCARFELFGDPVENAHYTRACGKPLSEDTMFSPSPRQPLK
jgi:hypothetical protein